MVHETHKESHMANYLYYILVTLGVGVLCSIPAIIISRLLAKRGWIRETGVWPVLGAIGILFFLRLTLPEMSIVYLAVVVTIVIPITICRNDVWTSLQKGKRWWEHEDNKQ